jgi:serine protease
VELESGAAAEYAIEKLPARSYYVIAGVDDNGNGKYFDDGERIGLYPSIDGPEPVPVKAGEVTRKVNFTLIVQGKAPLEETAPARVGSPCTGHSDCGNGGLCDESLAGGYCYKHCPGGDADCPSESSCFGAGDGAVCLVTCTSPSGGQGSCRSGYVCYAAAPKPICLPVCKSASDCAEGKSCDSGSGYCK